MMEESIFTFLNSVALFGWFEILCILLLQSTDTFTNSLTKPLFHVDPSDIISPSFVEATPLIIYALLSLEAICFVEVGRIAVGQLKGNLVLGVVLHMIRMTFLLLVLPNGLSSSVTTNNKDDYDSSFNTQYILSMAVLYSWALTEVGRYPMYLFPTSSKARYIRLVLPIVTFPLGAAAEAWGAYNVLAALWSSGDGAPPLVYWTKIGLLGMVVLVNGLLGPTMAYPALLKKGLPVLMGKVQKKKKE